MSYTDGIQPEDLSFIFCVDYWRIAVMFTCPRCGARVRQFIKLEELKEFEIECKNPACRLPDERAGYILSFRMEIEGSLLGENDRPLHTKLEISSWFDKDRKRK